MKHTQRLDEGRLAEVLNDRGMADLDAIRELLQVAQGGGMRFAEALVTSNLVSDWDLSRVVSEIFQLPFLPVEMVKPDQAILDQLDSRFLTQHGLVPISRFGQVMTVAMPGIVPADVLAMLAAETDLLILPVVGTVETNRRWLLENAKPNKGQLPITDWSAMFDEADAAVQLSLGDEDDLAEGVNFEIGEDLALSEDADLTAGIDDTDDLEVKAVLEDLASLEFTSGSDEEEPEGDSITLVTDIEGGGADIDLPPQPEFTPDADAS